MGTVPVDRVLNCASGCSRERRTWPYYNSIRTCPNSWPGLRFSKNEASDEKPTKKTKWSQIAAWPFQGLRTTTVDSQLCLHNSIVGICKTQQRVLVDRYSYRTPTFGSPDDDHVTLKHETTEANKPPKHRRSGGMSSPSVIDNTKNETHRTVYPLPCLRRTKQNELQISPHPSVNMAPGPNWNL